MLSPKTHLRFIRIDTSAMHMQIRNWVYIPVYFFNIFLETIKLEYMRLFAYNAYSVISLNVILLPDKLHDDQSFDANTVE